MSGVDPVHDEVDRPRAGEAGVTPIHELWYRCSRPFNTASAIAALTGLSHTAAQELVGTVLATSEEADRLIEEFPKTVRSLATAMGTQAERCIGELRGPVLWSETLSARASSFGDPDLFICATPSKAYDIDQNRVLVAALLAVCTAASDAVDHLDAADRANDAELARAAHNGHVAGRLVEHPSLRNVARGTLAPRAVKRTRTGKKRASYEPALQMLQRMAEPLSPEQLLAVCDRRTRAQHTLLVTVLHELESLTGRALPPLRVEQGRIYAGPVQYQHPGDLGTGLAHSGVLVGDLLLDVPEQTTSHDRSTEEARLAARAGGEPSHLVVDATDVVGAVRVAVELAAR